LAVGGGCCGCYLLADWLLATRLLLAVGCWQLAVALLLIVGCWLLLLYRCSAVGCWLLADCFVGFVISFLCWLFSCYSVAVAAGG
jgi:hypothetical protein